MASFSSIPKTHLQNIYDLNNLFASVYNMLLLPTTQRALMQDGQTNAVNELLDELLRLLDLCTTAKDALSMTRNSAQELQSVLRRKRGNSIELAHAIQGYQDQRKTVKKAILKNLKNSKSSSTKKIQETAAVVSLREVESVTFKVFESLLCMILGLNSKKWSLVSKLMGPKGIASDESPKTSLIEKVDVELAKISTSLQVENVQKEIAELEIRLEVLQEGSDYMYRHLIKTRVSLHNLVNC